MTLKSRNRFSIIARVVFVLLITLQIIYISLIWPNSNQIDDFNELNPHYDEEYGKYQMKFNVFGAVTAYDQIKHFMKGMKIDSILAYGCSFGHKLVQ